MFVGRRGLCAIFVAKVFALLRAIWEGVKVWSVIAAKVVCGASTPFLAPLRTWSPEEKPQPCAGGSACACVDGGFVEDPQNTGRGTPGMAMTRKGMHCPGACQIHESLVRLVRPRNSPPRRMYLALPCPRTSLTAEWGQRQHIPTGRGTPAWNTECTPCPGLRPVQGPCDKAPPPIDDRQPLPDSGRHQNWLELSKRHEHEWNWVSNEGPEAGAAGA